MGNESHSRVLIVDDVKINSLILSSILTSYGITSDIAESGYECIDMCKQKTYDLILLDHRMPDYDGVDTLLQLKEIFKHQGHSIPVICHTTEDARQNVNLYKAAGFADILFKPIQPKELSEILAQYLPEKEVVEKHHEKEEEKITNELETLPDWLKNFHGLDLHSSIEHCDTVHYLLETLTIFVSSIDIKSSDINKYAENEDWEAYTSCVHSLQGMARLIGANDLADLAAELEEAGKRKDLVMIAEQNPKLLSDYNAFSSLKEHLKPSSLEQQSPNFAPTDVLLEVPEAILTDAYNAISDFISCYDSESISMVLDSLMEYHLSDTDKDKTMAIRKALYESDWESMRAIMCIEGGKLS